MQGRYGDGSAGPFSFVCRPGADYSVFFFGGMILDTIALALLVWGYIRMFSRNHTKRWEENEKFLSLKDRILGRGGRSRKDSTHCYFQCPACGQKVRVPRGKGKIPFTVPGAIRNLSGGHKRKRVCSDTSPSNREELKMKDFDRYRGYYCGICRELKEHYGERARMTPDL